jgi:hypothetical protein
MLQYPLGIPKVDNFHGSPQTKQCPWIHYFNKMLSTHGKEGTKDITKKKYSTLFKRGFFIKNLKNGPLVRCASNVFKLGALISLVMFHNHLYGC